MTIEFKTQPASQSLKLDSMYIFQASFHQRRYADIGQKVQDAAAASKVDFIGGIQKPGLTLSSKLENLWLVFKESTNTTAASYAIVADLDEFEVDLFDEQFVGPLAAVIPDDARASLRVDRVVYSHNLCPNIAGTRGIDIFEGAGNLKLDWPLGFGAGMLLHCTFSFAGAESRFRLQYRVPAYSPKGTYKDVPSILEEQREALKKEEEAAKTNAEKAIARKRKKALGQLEKDAPKVKPGGTPKKLDSSQRKGPVAIAQVRLTLKGMSVEVDIDAGIELGPLKGKIINFQIELFLEHLASPRFDLDGVGLSYESAAFSIAGALLKQEMSYKDQGETLTTTAYNGGLLLKTPIFGLAGVASFALIKVKGTKEPSLFVFAMLQARGGITFFGVVTINGLALTLGYNRDFLVPTDTADIPDHPLIALVEAGGPPKDEDEDDKPTNGTKKRKAVEVKLDKAKSPAFDAGKDLDKLLGVLKSIKEFVPIKPHNVVAGIGLKANFVQLVDLFLMPVVSFNIDNGDLSLQLYGTASLALPKGADDDKAVLNLKAALAAEIPIKSEKDDKPLRVGLAIMEGSYFLGPFLKIEGGLAFYRHQGVTLFTIGGYGPLYRGVQPEWPTATPLSLSLQATDDIYMKVRLYFAWLPDAITFGLQIEGSAHAGGSHFSVKASFDVGADALLMWAPFYYEVEVHASFALHGKVSTWVCSKTFSFDLSAKLHLWGNEIEKWNGEAELTVHLLLTFHPTIEWGEPIGNFVPLTWREFKEQFAPHPEDEPTQIASGQCQVIGGVIDHQGEDKIPVVTPAGFEAEAKVFFPATRCTVNGESVEPWEPNRVGIQMIGLVREDYAATMAVTVLKDGAAVPRDHLHLEPVTDDLPIGLWKPATTSGRPDAPDSSGPKVVEKVPVGLRIRSHESEERASHAVDKQTLAFDVDEGADVQCRAAGRLDKGAQRTEEEVASSMVEHRPDADLLAALGIADAGAEVSFAPIKDTDLVGVPHLA